MRSYTRSVSLQRDRVRNARSTEQQVCLENLEAPAFRFVSDQDVSYPNALIFSFSTTMCNDTRVKTRARWKADIDRP